MKFLRFVFITVVAIFFFTSCAPATPERITLKVGYSLWPGSFPMLIAKEKGFFEKNGVMVETKLYTTIAAQSADYASGNLDGVALVLGDAILLDQNRPSKLILVTDFSDGADQVVASADIAKVADLKGKRIGVKFGTFGELLVRKMLQANGMRIDDVILVDVAPEALQNLLGVGVDAGHTYEPFTSQALVKGGHIIFDSSDVPGLIPDAIVFNATIAKNHPKALKAFVAAWFEAESWWKENPVEAASLLAKITGLKPEEISVKGIKFLDAVSNKNAFIKPGTDFSSLHFTANEYIKFLGTAGILSSTPDMDALLDDSFIQ